MHTIQLGNFVAFVQKKIKTNGLPGSGLTKTSLE